jgi:hypothetical protein
VPESAGSSPKSTYSPGLSLIPEKLDFLERYIYKSGPEAILTLTKYIL